MYLYLYWHHKNNEIVFSSVKITELPSKTIYVHLNNEDRIYIALYYGFLFRPIYLGYACIQLINSSIQSSLSENNLHSVDIQRKGIDLTQ